MGTTLDTSQVSPMCTTASPARPLLANNNTGWPGINFMQDGRTWGLTPPQKHTLAVLFKHGVPKLGIAPFRTLKVRGHMELMSSECPGKHIQRHLEWRREQPNR